ncbi:MAG: dTDP-glucose 4,6-dehydratase [Thermodesulfovibrio sp.]|uniref:dTDP-glucose 4,6-dehydratase n=1 Tax=Thermodesulfovibrio sp. 1176 TaxID=3043424 RepID=UPI002483226D|nr:dTDP-glucose 4,6-dehydratase [Thermodesulfovibrio sp. 1176]MDI1471630.1 dTDP-glucose 4,6-dehydratase [Thermodesulfovibrio sp. 1176]MDI6714301.1 dTDP-glucose 4,6-dehydratase [Thermodesulfovibrio sp.]
MKLLVTGGAGFIGSEFVRQAVKKGYDVAVVDILTYAGDLERLREVIDKITFYKVDIRNYSELQQVFEREKPECVIHFAAESHVDRSLLQPKAFIQTNIEGTLNLLELSKNFKIKRFINISTDEVYGELGDTGKFTEESPLKPNSPYSVSKAAQDMLGRAYFRSYGLPVITVRPSNNYGPWQYPEKLIPLVIAKALKDEPIPIYGTGQNVREWFYVSDCVEAILVILEKGKPGEVYNISSETEKRNIEVVKAILKLLGKPECLIEFVVDRPGHDYRYALDSSKIKRALGWSTKVDFETGLSLTVEWYFNHMDWLEKKVEELRDFWLKVYKK